MFTKRDMERHFEITVLETQREFRSHKYSHTKKTL